MPGKRLTLLDVALVALAVLALIGLEHRHRLDIEAPEAVVRISANACQDELENRRFVARRMLIADGSLPLATAWRSDRLAAACKD